MRTKSFPLLIGVSGTLLIAVLVACSHAGVVTAPPGNAGAAPAIQIGCTATPLTRRPTFTVAPSDILTPGAIGTTMARYHATYPGDVIGPTKTTDLAPQIPQEEKNTVIVRHDNCSYDYYYMQSSQIAAFKQNLPPGDKIVAEAPPQSLMGVHPTAKPFPTGLAPGVGLDVNGNVVTTQVVPTGSPPPPPSSALQTEQAQQVATRISKNTPHP